jgi:hypothetical protein
VVKAQAPEMTEVAGRRFRLASPKTANALGALVLVLIGATVALVALIHQLTIFNVVTGVPVRPPWRSPRCWCSRSPCSRW